MKNIKVLSLNLCNRPFSKNTSKLLNLLARFDIIGVQEGFYHLDKIITKELGYNSYGDYRFGNKLKYLKINENNNIITSNKVLRYNTYYLSILGSKKKDNIKLIKTFNLFSRIATVAIIKTDIGNICHINTHLSYGPDSIHKKQMEDLLELVNIYKDYDILLTGDFNADIDHPEFINFTYELSKYNINRVEINDYTFKDRHIDHIFVSNKFKVIDKGVINDLNDITDHNGIYVTLSK